MPKPIARRIEQYQQWLERRNERPLIGLCWEPDVYLRSEMLAESAYGRPVTADMIHPDAVAPYIERCYREACTLEMDLIQPFLAGFGIPWIEAMAGCPVIADPGSLWAAPCLTSYAGRAPVRLDPANPWLLKLLEFTRMLVELSDGRFPVSLPLTRGPLDVLSAMRGPRDMCLDLIDQPDEVAAVLDEIATLWIAANRAALELIPPFHGGYASRLKMWAPGPAVTPQNDISSAVSPRAYAHFALPCDRRMVGSFPYSSFHLHATEHHQIGNLLTLDDLTAVQTFLDCGEDQALMDAVLAAVRHALRSRPVIVGPLDIAAAERCLRELPPAGLCVMLATESSGPIPAEHKEWIARHCR